MHISDVFHDIYKKGKFNVFYCKDCLLVWDFEKFGLKACFGGFGEKNHFHFFSLSLQNLQPLNKASEAKFSKPCHQRAVFTINMPTLRL